MASGNFVAYYRVSTTKQGVSGLGLAAQRTTVQAFLNGGSWSLSAEFTEVESGRADDRPELARALTHCRLTGAVLVVANISRLTRSVAFLTALLKAGVEVRFCDLPAIEGHTGRFLLTQMVAVAELEAGMIANRTRKAMAAAKANGDPVGGGLRANSGDIHKLGTPASRAVRAAKADAKASDLAPVIREIQAGGASLRQVATELNARGIETPRPGGTWTSTQVSRVLDRAPLPAPAATVPATRTRRRVA